MKLFKITLSYYILLSEFLPTSFLLPLEPTTYSLLSENTVIHSFKLRHSSLGIHSTLRLFLKVWFPTGRIAQEHLKISLTIIFKLKALSSLEYGFASRLRIHKCPFLSLCLSPTSSLYSDIDFEHFLIPSGIHKVL